MIWPSSQNFNLGHEGHDGTLLIENFILMIKKYIALQIFDCTCPVNWSTTRKCAPWFRGNMEFPIYWCFNMIEFFFAARNN
jgi:hypothetical protein